MPKYQVNTKGFMVNEEGLFVDTNGNRSAIPIKATEEQHPVKDDEFPPIEQIVNQETSAQPTKQPTNQTLTQEQITSMVEKAVSEALAKGNKQQQAFGLRDLSAVISEAISSGSQQSNRRIGTLPIKQEEIPIDDILETPVEFYAYSQMYTILDDYRHGHAILPPYGKIIKFHNLVRTRKTTLNNKIDGGVIAISKASIGSKKQVEWLENHSLLGITFFKSVDMARNVSAVFAEKLRQVEASFGRTELEVIQKAKEMGVPLNSDIASLRSQMVFTIASALVQVEAERYILPEVDFGKESSKKKTLEQQRLANA